MQPKVSVITVNFNGERFLRNFFASLDKIDYKNQEVIFVDNNSSDGSVAYVRKNYPKIKVLENRVNLGFAVANNLAAKMAAGEYLFFLNNDAKIAPAAIFELATAMEKDPKIGAAGCQMKDYDGKKTLHAGIGLDIFGYPLAGGKTFYVEGSALMVKKSLFLRLGGFDEKYFMFHEDIDLCWRIWLAGYQIVPVEKAVIYHAGGTSAGGKTLDGSGRRQYQSSFLRRYYSERNNIRTLLKNYQIANLLWILPLYFLLNLAEFFLYLFTGNFKIAYFYPKAYLWNLINLPETLKERIKIQRQRKISDREIIKKMRFASGKILGFKKIGLPKFKEHYCYGK